MLFIIVLMVILYRLGLVKTGPSADAVGRDLGQSGAFLGVVPALLVSSVLLVVRVLDEGSDAVLTLSAVVLGAPRFLVISLAFTLRLPGIRLTITVAIVICRRSWASFVLVVCVRVPVHIAPSALPSPPPSLPVPVSLLSFPTPVPLMVIASLDQQPALAVAAYSPPAMDLVPATEEVESDGDASVDSIDEGSLAFATSNQITVFTQPDEAVEPEVAVEPMESDLYPLPAPPSCIDRTIYKISEEEDDDLVSVHWVNDDAELSPASTPTLLSDDGSVASSLTSSSTIFSAAATARPTSPSDDGEKKADVAASVKRCRCSSVPQVGWRQLLNAKPKLAFFANCSHRPPISSVVDIAPDWDQRPIHLIATKPGVVKRAKLTLNKIVRRHKGGRT